MQIPYRHSEKIKINQHTKTPSAARFEAFPAAICILPEKPGAADWVQLPHELLGRISNRIINEVDGVNRAVYDISPKPPSTIEWE